MGSSESNDRKIVRERKLRKSGTNSNIITIPPICSEFTDFATGDNVEIEAEIGGEEIILRRVGADESENKDEN